MFDISSEMLWRYAEKLQHLFSFLSSKEQGRRGASVLMASSYTVQDYLTRSGMAFDDECNAVADHIFRVYRAGSAIQALYGTIEFDEAITRHHLFKEALDLFSQQRTQCESSVFNLYSAALFQHKGRFAVTILKESDRNREQMPDFRVNGIAYVESKDLHSVDAQSLVPGIRDRLEDAVEQLVAQQGRARLPFSLVCVDVPSALTLDDQSVFDLVRPVLFHRFSESPMLTSVVLSHTGLHMAEKSISYPHKWKMIARPGFGVSAENVEHVRRFGEAFAQIITLSPDGAVYQTCVDFVD